MIEVEDEEEPEKKKPEAFPRCSLTENIDLFVGLVEMLQYGFADLQPGQKQARRR